MISQLGLFGDSPAQAIPGGEYHPPLPSLEEPAEVRPDEEKPSKLSIENTGQLALLEVGEWYDEHWKGMPEFVQKDLSPYKTVYVHFENRQDMEAFAKLVDQTVTLNTRSLWYPEAEIGRIANKRWIDAPPKDDSGDDNSSIEVLDEGGPS